MKAYYNMSKEERKKIVRRRKIIAAIMMVLGYILIYGANWLITCGVVKALTICFSLSFSWKVATGIWIIVLLVRWIFQSRK